MPELFEDQRSVEEQEIVSMDTRRRRLASEEAEHRKEEGKKKAADRAPKLLKSAQDIAIRLASWAPTEGHYEPVSCKLITSDDVAKALGEQLWQMLGNARGSVFSTGKWKWTGKMVESTRPSAHKRMIKVWRLK